MRLIKYCSNIYMKKKRTISKNRSSYKKKIKRSKSKRKKRTKTKSRTKTIETTELMKWIQGKTKKKTRKKTRKKSKKKSKTYRKRVKRGGSAPTPANSPRRRGEAEALEEEELRQPEVVDEGLGSIEEGQEGQQGQQAQEEVEEVEEEEEEYEDEGGEPLPQYIPPVEEIDQEVAAEGLELVEQQPGIPPPPSDPPPPPPVEGDEPVEVEEPVEVRGPFRPGAAVTREPYVGSQTAAARAIAQAQEQAEAEAGEEEEEEEEEEDDQPPPVPPRPEEDVSQVEPITQRRPEEEEEEGDVGGEEEEKSLWKKLKTFVQGTEYEQFIQEMGQELKELFTEYLNGYFEDLENGEDVDFLRAKYESFIDAYYKKAIAKDRALIEKLKGEEGGEE